MIVLFLKENIRFIEGEGLAQTSHGFCMLYITTKGDPPQSVCSDVG